MLIRKIIVSLRQDKQQGLTLWEWKYARVTETARKMKADGMSADIIAKYTGLTIEEIDAL